jgi:cytochrome P450
MPVSTEEPAHAAWDQDRPDSTLPPFPQPPFFDHALDAWVLTRYSDITEALRQPSLLPASLTKRNRPPASITTEEHQHLRDDARGELSPARMRVWKRQLTHEAQTCANALSHFHPVDLLADYARPVCLSFAASVTGIDDSMASSLCEKSRRISAFAADPYNSALKAPAKSAAHDLKPVFPPGPESMRDAGFVALSQTLPALLGNIWFALVQHPREWQRLHQNPHLVPRAIEELIRYAGFTRGITRYANVDLTIGEAFISKGQHVLLRIQPAHHDPEYFRDPSRLEITRRAARHLSFGAGGHACVGAGLLRMACSAITRPLLSNFASANLAASVSYQGGAVFVSPEKLSVNLLR